MHWQELAAIGYPEEEARHMADLQTIWDGMKRLKPGETIRMECWDQAEADRLKADCAILFPDAPITFVWPTWKHYPKSLG